MPRNDFLPFATGAGANVLSQADYAALAALPTGYVRGRAASAQLNKTWRQSGFIAAVLAEYIMETLGVDVLDDGDVAGLVAKLKASIVAATPRQELTAALTYYVDLAGNDAHDGTTPATAWRSLQHAFNVINSTVDFAGHTITVQLADGTYGQGLTAAGAAIGATTPTPIIIQGNLANKNAVTINTVGGICVAAETGAGLSLRYLSLQSARSGGVGGYGIASELGGTVYFDNLSFLDCDVCHVTASSSGSVIARGAYEIRGDAPNHVFAAQLGYIQLSSLGSGGGITVTLTGSPNFSDAFASAQGCSEIIAPTNTWLGSATGRRYAAALNGIIFTNGQPATYLPGDAAGTLATGGQYG